MKTETYVNQVEYDQLPDRPTEDFTVYRDGEVDTDWLNAQKRAERIERVKDAATAITGALRGLGKQIGRGISDMVDEWDAHAYDQRHGTDYHKQLLQKRAIERNARFAGRLGLN